MQYDLYRVPFNEGKGGEPEPIRGRFGKRDEQHFPEGVAGRPLDRFREMQATGS